METFVDVDYNSLERRKMKVTNHYIRNNNLMIWYPQSVKTRHSNTYFEIDRKNAIKLARDILKFYNATTAEESNE